MPTPTAPPSPGRWTQRRRDRALASDRRAGSWARGRARRAQRTYLRQHWRPLLLAAAVMLTPVLLAAALIPSALARGFLLGAGTASIGGVLAVWVLQVTGTAPAMMGDLAEQWTASELRPLRHRGWRLLNRVRLRAWDIDHVLLGPTGPVVAVETKWSSQPWRLHPPDDRLLRAVRQAHDNARDLQRWADLRHAGAPPVQAVVMLWGPGSSHLDTPPAGLHIDGVAVVPGPAAQRWRDTLPDVDLLTPAQVDQAWHALLRQADRADRHDALPLPPSFAHIAGTIAATTFSAALAIATAAALLPLVRSLYLWAPACLALLAAAQPLRRRDPTRLPALGWQTALAGTLLIATTALLLP